MIYLNPNINVVDIKIIKKQDKLSSEQLFLIQTYKMKEKDRFFFKTIWSYNLLFYLCGIK